mgnify:CR=1 FL=1
MASLRPWFNKVIRDYGSYKSYSWNPNHYFDGILIGQKYGVSAPMLAGSLPGPVGADDMEDLDRNFADNVLDAQIWIPLRADEIDDQKTAEIIADHALSYGTEQAVSLAQTILVQLGERLEVSGFVDSKTVASLNAVDPEILHDAYKRSREQLARNEADPNFRNFLMNQIATFPDRTDANSDDRAKVDKINYSAMLRRLKAWPWYKVAGLVALIILAAYLLYVILKPYL